ncbi:MAG: histone deacetylase [Chloroflexi bacterium]|nr:MAG: histone deacetylase [Chloroflexota bacterium]PIE80475.1 MAG: histone deacetylase [Chloroflexota bacterium]
MKIFTYDQFTFPLPDSHRFPAEKYQLLREAVAAAQVVPPDDLIVPTPATTHQLRHAHSREYLTKVENGRFSPSEIRRIGLPWSPELVVRCKHSVGATIAACRVALKEGIAVTLGGGTHHASYDAGEGFCIYNDAVAAARTMQAEGRAQRIAIIDCDVHQGNGTAQITTDDDSIFTFSIHAEKNFPFHKIPSNLDIALPDDIEDEAYLRALQPGIEQTLAQAKPELVIYLAGADVFAGDRLGRLCLTKEGIGKRDRLALAHCWEAGVSVAVTMAGGYGRSIHETVAIQLQTVQIAATIQNL